MTRHGHRAGGPSPTYVSWRCMRLRCEYPKHRSYPDYGGAGITVCARWKGRGGFARFLADVGVRPSVDVPF